MNTCLSHDSKSSSKNISMSLELVKFIILARNLHDNVNEQTNKQPLHSCP